MDFRPSDFKFEISDTELKTHLLTRVAYHQKRTEKFKAKAEKIRSTDGEITIPQELLELFEEPGMAPFARGPRGAQKRNAENAIREQALRLADTLSARGDSHLAAATTLTFFADHLPKLSNDAKHQIGVSDLDRFELLPDLPRVALYGAGMGFAPASVEVGGSSSKSLDDYVEQEAF